MAVFILTGGEADILSRGPGHFKGQQRGSYADRNARWPSPEGFSLVRSISSLTRPRMGRKTACSQDDCGAHKTRTRHNTGNHHPASPGLQQRRGNRTQTALAVFRVWAPGPNKRRPRISAGETQPGFSRWPPSAGPDAANAEVGPPLRGREDGIRSDVGMVRPVDTRGLEMRRLACTG